MARASSAIDKRANEFLADDCGQNALQLASRGAALIAEILRLSEHIPQVFLDPSTAPQYQHIVCDFEYFKKQEEFEKRIENSAELLERDEEFRLTHLELLERFFKLFRGIHGYAVELNRYISDIREAMYISQSLETILVHPDGKQLLCEVYYLFGVMLLLMDTTMGGKIREYLIVSFVRYKGAGDQVTVDVAHLCRATGYVKGKEPPERYPEQLFQRVPLDREVIEMIVGRIRSDDVYQSAFHYPAPEHRSTALATQSSMLYVLLFFVPRVLDLEKQVMREVVDKHFVDNWVITFYLGYTVDLVVAWSPFKAAYAAIQGTIELENVSYHLDRHKKALVRLNPIVEGLLRDGVLTEQYVLDNIGSTLLPTVRESNVTLRWFILHMTRGLFSKKESFKKSYAAVANAVSADSILSLLLGVAQLEFILKEMFEQLLTDKRAKWREAKESARNKMQRLSQYFSGEHVLSESKVAALETWFADIAGRIESLSYADSVTANRKVQKIMKALENVQEFHHVQDNLQVVQFLQDTRQLMRQMIRIINIERKVLISIDTVGDLSYAWELLATHRCFVDDIQRQIKNTPRLALQMRSVFIKLSTMLSIPCQRIFQAEVNDSSLASTLESVSEYYSTELVRFVNQVLHVIPVSIFEALKQIMHILVRDLEACPTRLNRSEMKRISQPDVRRQLSRLTSEVSQFAAGILAMETTLVGVVKVEPHQLLEDGIRRELVAQVTQQLDALVQYDKQRTFTAAELDKMLSNVATQLGGIRAAFEYIQDYVNIHGLQIWLQEFSRIIHFNVDMESNAFMAKKILPFQSQYQSDRIPIPAMQGRSERDAYSFVGRIQLHLLRMTRSAIFIPALGAWYELPSGQQAVGERTFNAILNAVGPQGLSAVDRVLCFSTAKELQTVIDENKKICDAILESFDPIEKALMPTSGLPLEHYQKAYEQLSKAPLDKLLTTVGRRFHNIGRAQLIRTHIARELDANCKLQSTALHLALKAVNDGLLADISRHYAHPLEHPIPGQIIPELNPFFELCGVTQCQTKVYVTSRPVANLAFIIAALYVRLSGEFAYEPKYSCLVPVAALKKGADVEGVIDAYSLASGTITLLRQFHSEHISTFLSLMAQFCRLLLGFYNVAAQEHRKKKPNETLPLGPRPAILTRMLENLMEVAGLPIHELGRAIPTMLLEQPLEF